MIIGSPVTFTAQVNSAAGTPSGTVTFFEGANPLGTSALSGGASALTTSTLAGGTHNSTAVYNGADIYAASTSPVLAESVLDLSMAVSGGHAGGASSTATTVGVKTGGSASVLLLLNSKQNAIMPVNSTLTVTGQPAGTTITLARNNWQATSASSWLYPKGYAFTNPTLTFKLPSQLAKSESAPPFPGGAKSALLSLLLLPFLRRGRKSAKRLVLLAVLALSMAGTLGMTGCAANNGFYAEKSYPVAITLTAGAVTKVSYVTLNVK